MEQISRYPLIPMLSSIGHLGGTMQKTLKSKLLEDLEKIDALNLPANVDINIDDMFFFHLLYQPPSTFADLAGHLLRQVCKQRGTEFHLAFDKTILPSINDAERNKRSNQRGMVYQITGPEQKCSSNWLQALRGGQFKEDLVTFLANYLEKNKYVRSQLSTMVIRVIPL